MRVRLSVILLLIVLVCVACNVKPVIPTTLPPNPVALPTMATSATPTLVPSLTPIALPTATSTPIGITPLPGLIYKTGKELWRIDSNGEAVRLLAHSFDFLSPDGTSVVDLKGSRFSDEMWLIDLVTGQQRNLTAGLGRSLCCVTWWPERSNAILFGSWPLEIVGRNSGYLSMIQADGSGFKILDDKNTFAGAPAPSPDGVAVAYTGGPTGMIYQWEKGSVPFDPGSFGLSVDYLRSPSWSPDGKKMAWAALKGDLFGFVIFDLVKHTAEWIHPYRPTNEWTPAPIWSPDGQWLALLVNNDDSMKQELWIVPVDGSQDERLLRDDPVMAYPIWSPDGHWLASGNTLYEVGTWRAQPLALPPNAEVVAWISPTE